MRVGAIDIGTNSMRLLVAEVTDGDVQWLDRRTTVTGLGVGVDADGRLDESAVDRTIGVLAGYGRAMAEAGVVARRGIATSATRDAANREEFLDRAELALGFRPEVVTGEEEAALAFAGATRAVDRTIGVLAGYGRAMAEAGVVARRGIATSATRDAANRDQFLDRAELALGFRPEVVTGEEEAALAFAGATRAVDAAPPYVVIDIGGGSTEFVLGTDHPEYRTSVDIGSVRLTDRILKDRPASPEQLAFAQDAAADALAGVDLPSVPEHVIGVAGTFTSLSAVSQDLPAYDPGRVHGSTLTVLRLSELVLYLSLLTVEETAAIPSMDPARAPVILAGAVVAAEAVRRCGVDTVHVSEHDSLDGIALALASA